jgi:hypothetical protein
MTKQTAGSMLYRWGTVAVAAALSTPGASASHFRGGTLSWSSTNTPGEARFHFVVAFRRNEDHFAEFPAGIDIYPEAGDIIADGIGGTRLNFGDGTFSAVLRFQVIDFSVTGNYILAAALEPGGNAIGVPHLYAGAGPFRAFVAHRDGVSPACCRLDNLANRAGGNYPLETRVSPFSGNAAPLATFTPVVRVPRSGAALFSFPAADPDGDAIRWRLAIENEASGLPGTRPPGSGPHARPPGLTIDAETGLVSWNNIGLAANRFWTAQIMVEDLDERGLVKSKTPIDFLLRICPEASAPSLSIDPEATELFVQPGETVDFTISAAHPVKGQAIELAVTGLPSAAMTDPALPLAGPGPLSANVEWTAPPSEQGVHLLLFTATELKVDGSPGCQVLLPVSIVVEELLGCEPPICQIDAEPVINIVPGALVSFQVQGTGHCQSIHLDADENGLPAGAYTDPKLPQTGEAPARITTEFRWIPTFEQAGTHIIGFIASDEHGQESRCYITVRVIGDNLPPTCLTNINVHLWPPNQNFRTINVPLVSHVNDPEGEPLQITSVLITQDEPVGTEPDARSVGTPKPQVRSERRGGGNGRIYHVTYTAVDSVGWTCTGIIKVHVPRSQGQNAVDDGQAFDSTVPE